MNLIRAYGFVTDSFLGTFIAGREHKLRWPLYISVASLFQAEASHGRRAGPRRHGFFYIRVPTQRFEWKSIPAGFVTHMPEKRSKRHFGNAEVRSVDRPQR